MQVSNRTLQSSRIAVVVLANTYDQLASNTVEDILSTLLPAYRDARTRATHAAAAGRPATPLEQAQYHNGELDGSFAGNLGVDDADRRRRYTLRLVLLRRSNNEFNGGVWTRPIPGLDNGPLHTYWVQLTR